MRVFWLMALLLSACGGVEKTPYHNDQIGLALDYPAYWQLIDAEQVAAGIAASAAQMEASAETLAQAQAITSGLQLSVVRPENQSGSPGGASLNIIAIVLPEAEWAGVNLEAIVAAQTQGVGELADTVTRPLEKGRLPAGMKGYLAVLPTRQGHLYQYQLSYWRAPHYVQLVLSSLTENDVELADIVKSLRLTPKKGR